MKKRFSGTLPQKQLKTKLKFEEPVFCQLQASMTGKKEDTATAEEKKELSMSECTHEVWPTFWPQCMECIYKNKHERYLVDKKREYKVIESALSQEQKKLNDK